MKKYYIRILIILMILMMSITMLTGCSSTELVYNTEDEEKTKIVTSFYPIYILTANITKDIDNIELVNLTEPTTGCLHDYSITTEEMKILEDSDIFIINGANMESFMDKVIEQNEELIIIESSEGIELIYSDHNHDNCDGEHHDNPNPHVWLSISNAIEQVKNIEEKLIEYDPANKEKYVENANEYIEKLENQKEKMHKELEDLANRDIITFHESFEYFAKEFDLNIVGVIEREPGSQPSAKELAETIELIKELEINAIFAEPQYPPKAAETIANETQIKVFTLDPIVTGEMELDAYEMIMDRNLDVLKEALK